MTTPRLVILHEDLTDVDALDQICDMVRSRSHLSKNEIKALLSRLGYDVSPVLKTERNV